jgi:glutaredoxin
MNRIMDQRTLRGDALRKTETMSTTLYWRPGCPFCSRLQRKLRRAGIDVDELNIWTDPDAAAAVRSITGGDETVPTLVIGDQAMVNPSPRRAISAITEHRRRAAPGPSTSTQGR